MKSARYLFAILLLVQSQVLVCAQILQPPVNDNFADRIILYGTNPVGTSYTYLATTEPGEPRVSGSTTAHTIWWSWTAPVSGPAVIDTAGSNFDTYLGVFAGDSLPTLINLLINDDGVGLISRATGDVVAGQTYQIVIDGFAGAVGYARLNIRMTLPVPTNDNFASRMVIPGLGGRKTATNAGGTREAGEPVHAGLPGGESLWYSWTAPRTGEVRISATSPTIETILGVYAGNDVSQLADASDPINAGIISKGTNFLNFKVFAGETYAMAVDGLQGRVGDITLTVAQGGILIIKGALNFGVIPAGTTKSTIVRVSNSGNTSLKIRGIDLPKGFKGKLQTTIPPNGFRNVRVTFSPSRAGVYSGNLTVRSDSVTKASTAKITAFAQ